MPRRKGNTKGIVRDAKTGRFVKASEAKKRPSTTVTERRQRKRKC